MSKAEIPTKVVTGEIRFSYVHVFEPHGANEGAKQKYSVQLLIPKSDKATLAKIDKAVKAAIEAGKAKYGGKIPNNLKLPLRDGDEEKPGEEVYEGMMFVNATSDNKPSVVDENIDPIMDKAEFYSGCWGRASINFYPFNTNGNKGVACGLNHVQKLRDDDHLGGGSTAAEDFGSDDLM